MSMLLQVFPSRAESARDLPSLESAMQNLALDEHSPIALEIAATSTSRQFLLRAEEKGALHHLAGQIQARYPQAAIREVNSDPLELAPSEECSVLELRPGAASYLPLRAWNRRELLEEGADPLLGILAAFGDLPEGVRAVAQLALLPASPTWSASQRRRAVEHPLEKEHVQQRQGAASPPSLGRVLLLFLFVGLLTLVSRFHQILLPSWLLQAGSQLLHGHTPQVSLGQMFGLVGILAGMLVLGFFVVLALSLWGSRFGQAAIYDQRLVGEKTALPAYRTRLRLSIIVPGPVPQAGTKPAQEEDEAAAPVSSPKRLQRLPQGCARPLLAAFLAGDWQRWRVLKEEQKARRRAWQERAQQRDALLRTLAAAYRQYHLAAGGYFRPQRLSIRHTRALLAPVRGWPRLRFWWSGWVADVPRSTHFLSIADLAALWHLPQAQDLANLSYVEQEGARTLLAPGVLASVQGYRVGASTHAGQTVPVLLPFSCLQQNTLVVASTGKGKSSLFFLLARAFFAARLARDQNAPLEKVGGMVLIDPHGDLTELVLGSIPPELEDEVVLIDLADALGLVGLNPLDMSRGQDRDKVIDNVIQIVEALWRTSYGPRTENILEYACKTLAEANLTLVKRDPLHGADEQFTLLDILPLLRRQSFRHAIFELVEDEVLIDWWKHYYEPLDPRQQNEYTSSVLTKLSKFASTRTSRRMLGQPRSTIDLAEIIREEKILLVNCASGEVGGDLAALIGSVIVGLFQVALAEQARFDPDDRRRCLMLIDEFQALAGVNYQTMLAELRKYGGSFALATQSLAYLDSFERTLRASVLANVEHIFAFAMAPDDARLLRLDGVEPEDITRLADYACYARLGLRGHRLPTFSLQLDPPTAPDAVQRRRIQDRSRNRFARLVGDIEAQLHALRTRQQTMQPKNPLKDPLEEGARVEPKPTQQRRKRQRGKGGRTKNAQGDNLIHQIYEQDIPAARAKPSETPSNPLQEDLGTEEGLEAQEEEDGRDE